MKNEMNEPSQTGYTQIYEDDYNMIRVEKNGNKINIKVGHPTDPFEVGGINLNINEAKIIQHAIYKMIQEIKQ